MAWRHSLHVLAFSFAKLVLFFQQKRLLLGAGPETLTVDPHEATMIINRHLWGKNSNNPAGVFPDRKPEVKSPRGD